MFTVQDVKKKWTAIWMKILGKPSPVKVVELASPSTSIVIPLKLMQNNSIQSDRKVAFKYFTKEETKGLWDDLVYKLDRAREFFGNPIVITSGYRDPAKNDEVGGVKDSAHTTGKAVDIRIPQDPFMRSKLAWALGAAGFRRVLFYDRHAHCDIDMEKPHPIFIDGGKSH